MKEHPDRVQQLSLYKVATERISSFNVAIEPVTFTHFRAAQGLSENYGLLTNDSLTAAVMQSLSLTDLASNDPDFSLVPGFTIWRPHPRLEGGSSGETESTDETSKAGTGGSSPEI